MCPVGDLGLAPCERDRVVERWPFRTRSKFLSTLIRQRLNFCALPSGRVPLVLNVILSSLVAPLVLGIDQPAERGLLELATIVAAVSLSSIVAAADEERPGATAAAQLEQEYFVHPSRKDENWTAASGSTMVATYRLSIR